MQEQNQMRWVRIALAIALLTGGGACSQTPVEEVETRSPSTETIQPTTTKLTSEMVKLTGILIHKQWSHSVESWMAGGSDYYVLDVGDVEIEDRSAREGAILRVSDAVTEEIFAAHVGQNVEVWGEYVAAEPYVPQSPMESYPMDMNGNPLPRGAGFKVYEIQAIE